MADTTNNRIRKITAAGWVTTLAGQATAGTTNATGTAAQFSGPNGIALSADGVVLYVGSTPRTPL